MYKKTVTYKDYNGVERTEDFYFNLSAAELAELTFSVNGGLQNYIQRIIDAQDMPAIVKEFKQLVLLSYGEKDESGKYFMKSEEISNKFASTEAYSQIFMELAMDDKKASEFVNAIVPQETIEELEKRAKAEETNSDRQDVAPQQ